MPYERKTTKYNFEKDRKKAELWNDAVLEEERQWVVERVRELEEEGGADSPQTKGKGKEKASFTEKLESELEDGEGIECQCCFSEYAFVSCRYLSVTFSVIQYFTVRQTWFSALKPISFARLASLNTLLPNSVRTVPLSFACILPNANSRSQSPSFGGCWTAS